MRTLNPTRRAAQVRPSTLRLSATAAGVACLVAAGSPALAQQQDTSATDPNTQSVVVTGIRRGIESAISVKKNATSIVEAVSAEDIGKLPDNSIAESIARLPGLSAQRVAGRAQVISVRGLSPDFATTLLNGRELVSTGDNRSVEFDQYPSELMSSVLIYKTPDASLVGQGLSGTLDMQTIRPLDQRGRVISLNGRFERNSLGSAANAKGSGNRFSVSYIDQFADRTVGVLLGFAHLETPVQENQVGLYEPWKTDSRNGLAAGTWESDGIKSLRRTGVNKRDGLMASIEWRPSKAWTSTLDLYHSKFTKEDTANQFEVNLGDYNGGFTPGLKYTGVTVNGDKTLTGGAATGVYPLVRGMYNNREDKIDAIGLNNKFKAGEATIVVDASYSKAKRDELSLENNTQLTPVPSLDTVTVNYATGGFPTLVPGLNYSDASKLLLRNTIYGSGYGKVPHIDDELKGFKVQATMPLPSAVSSLLPDLDVGLNYADRTKRKRQPEGNINVGPGGERSIPSDLLYSPVDLGFSGTGVIPSWNVPEVVSRYMVFQPSETSAGYLISKAWNVFEKTTTGYAKANIETQLGGISVRGNVGLQLQRVDQSSSANYFDNSAAAGSQVKPVNDGKTYTDALPSLNLAFDLGGDQVVRLALAKQVARPRVDQLRAAIDFNIDTATGKPSASGGNPRLDPWRANAFDLSYEKYFGTKAYFAAAAFYKDLKSYIYTQSRDYDFSKFTAGTNATTNTGTFTAPYNGQGGRLSGIELAASVPLKLVTPALDGFGIQASASFTNSNIKIKDPDSASSVGSGDITLPGLSKRVTQLTAYYEGHGFEARLSQRKRSDFIGEIGNFAGNRTLRYVVGESILDAQLGYSFDSGPMKGLSLLLQVNNINNTPYKTYAGTKDRPLEYIEWGRSFLLGADYKF
ncbi:TonB-dependent receptor [Aquabacterium sp.]|uniref:TonB-dependent receptor n=1 Tax=Aquabacterium sp. TaxID=1872578 RepID=UPI003783CD0C